MEEAPRKEGPSPPQRRKNAAVLCSCGQPARLVVVPTSYMPGQRCWRCANPHVQCFFAMWHGPWVNERSIIDDMEFRERERARARGRSTQASASSSTAETSEESKNEDKS
ncbi:hypothetical protein M5689_024877 [Euphorbia peplus]|nr:hypothetical protein M5689_024877 [Euphorbia peplus]